MSELRAELAELIADVRTLLDDAVGRGLRHEARPDVEEAPPAEAVPQGDAIFPPSRAPVARPRPAPEERPVPVEPPPSPSAEKWAAAAARARADALPLHHDDGQGAAGLARIRADLGDCTRCGLCAGRQNIVFGVGDPDADLMVVGEGPGATEDERGEPFVGEAGQMLDKMLANVIGLPRERVYIANVVKCRPPDNRNPSPEESAVCKPFLFRQIEAVQPKVILVLGSVALEQLLGAKGITRLRGQEMSWRGMLAIPTFHPAYLLRKPEDKRFTLDDLRKVKARYDALGGRR